MKPVISLDATQWKAAANQLHQTSSRTCVDFTNGQALKVAIESVRQTEKANRQQIAHVLGAVGQQVEMRVLTRGKNKGKIRMKRGAIVARENSFAERILIKRRIETGKWGVKGDSIKDKVANFIASAQRSAGFIASGWIGARNVLWSLVKKKPAGMRSTADAKQYGKPKGSAKAAVFSLRSKIESIIANTALKGNVSNPPAPGGNPMPIAQRGLQMALNVAAKDMINELARRLNPDFKKVSAR